MMLDLRFVRDHIEEVKLALRHRGLEISFDEFTDKDLERRRALAAIDELRHRRNTLSQEVGNKKKAGLHAEAEPLMEQVREINEKIKHWEAEADKHDPWVRDFLLNLPNLPDASVPVGESEEDNPVIKTWGERPRFTFEPQAHWDLGENLGILDFERAAKIAGARYLEVLPPFIANADSLQATGQLPKFQEDLFKLEGLNYFLVPTAEVPVTNIHRQEILREEDLPINYTAYTPCFRSEAGSYGKDVRGLIRQHQFDKVELVKFTTPDTSYDELELLLQDAEEVLQELGLHYRVVVLCTGDMGFAAAKTYDIEVWLPGQQLYREISSCSNFTDYQARRAEIRFKRPGAKGTELVHTLNGSGLAVGRTMVAILENYQQEDGSVIIPEKLRPYMGGMDRIGRK
ncbi:MAG: serine--tRNA ligase [Syntrophobacterales bacterium]